MDPVATESQTDPSESNEVPDGEALGLMIREHAKPNR